MFFRARAHHYHLAGMKMPPEMYIGMMLIIAGTLIAVYGAFLAHQTDSGRREFSNFRVHTLDTARIKSSHIVLVCTLTVAIAIDIMKPATLAFIAPGAEMEYHLRGPLLPHAHALPIALYPISGIAGTVLGSILWGVIGDRAGRRPALLIANSMFIASSTCGVMPAYWMNLICCLFMGIGAGGMLPIAVTVLSESIPARHRAWLMVLVGGSGIGLGYFATSWLSATIGAPDRLGWRIMWLISLPTGLLLVVLNRWIPESPRFLLLHGREEEACAVMKRYGAVLAEDDQVGQEESQIEDHFGQLFSDRSFVLDSCVLLFTGISIGLFQYGFQQWLPSDLEKLGYTAVGASTVIRNASLYGLPITVPVAFLYGFWSSRRTIIVLILVNLLDMLAFAASSGWLAQHVVLMEILLIVPSWSVGLLASILTVYASEIYPTRIRSRGCGLAAGAAKFGGVLILVLVATEFTASSIRVTSLIAMISMLLVLPAIIMRGPETSGRSLELITDSRTRSAA